MSRFDKAVIKRMQDKLDMTEAEAKKWLNMIRKIAADEYEKQFKDGLPF
jgi:hypothetical protein